LQAKTRSSVQHHRIPFERLETVYKRRMVAKKKAAAKKRAQAAKGQQIPVGSTSGSEDVSMDGANGHECVES
jgi:hypothetical protein